MLAVITIFFVAVICVSVVSVLGFSFYVNRKTKRLRSENQKQFDSPPVYKSLFAPTEAEMRALESERLISQDEERRRKIIAAAEAKDFNALLEARISGADFYDEVLSKLVEKTVSDEKFVSLLSFVERNDLPANAKAVERSEKIWQKSFGKKETVRLMHLAAKTGSAEIFSKTLENVLQHWHAKFLSHSTLKDLLQLAESEFWILPPDAKTSGAGFLLKQKLSELRREIE